MSIVYILQCVSWFFTRVFLWNPLSVYSLRSACRLPKSPHWSGVVESLWPAFCDQGGRFMPSPTPPPPTRVRSTRAWPAEQTCGRSLSSCASRWHPGRNNFKASKEARKSLPTSLKMWWWPERSNLCSELLQSAGFPPHASHHYLFSIQPNLRGKSETSEGEAPSLLLSTLGGRDGHCKARLRGSLVDVLAAQFPPLQLVPAAGGRHLQTGGGELPAGRSPCPPSLSLSLSL